MTKGERTRRRIVSEATAVFNRQGYAGTSISDITEAAQIKKGGLYGHFSGKDEIALAAFSHAVQNMKQRMRSAVDAAPTAPKKLVAMVSVFEALALDETGGGCPILNTAVEMDDSDAHPALRDRVRDTLAQWREWTAQIVEQGIADGDIRPYVTPDVVATTVISVVEGAMMMSRIEDNPAHIRRAVQHVARYVQRELAASSAG